MNQRATTVKSSLVDLLQDARLRANPNSPLLAGVHAISWGEFVNKLNRLSARFAESGLSEGEAVLIASENAIAVTLAVIACMENGLIAAVHDPNASQAELRQALEITEPSLVVADERHLRDDESPVRDKGILVWRVAEKRPSASGFLAGLRRKTAEQTPADDFFSLVENTNPTEDRICCPSNESIALILFTSGSTGVPKGVELTHENLASQLKTFIRHYGYDLSMRLLNNLPMHHTDGLTHGPLIAAACAAMVYRPARFAPNTVLEFLDTIYRERITHMITVPTVLAMIDRLASDETDAFRTPDFRFIRSSAGPLPETLWRRFEERFGVLLVNSYGLTETVCEAIYCGPSDATRRTGTIDKPVDCEAKIVGDDGDEVPVGEAGELLIRGSNVMRGYRNTPEETSRVLQDGWFRTGDIVVQDGDGFIRIVGRKKSMIIRGGVNIFPEEVIAALQSLPGIADGFAVGRTDEIWGERLTACVVAEQSIDTEQIAQGLRRLLAPEKMPDEIRLFAQLPRDENGKIRVARLREMLDELADHEEQKLSSPADLEEELKRLAASILNVSGAALGMDVKMEDVPEWDSLAHVNLLMAAETAFDIKLSPRDIMTIDSLASLRASVEAKLVEK